MGFEALQVEVSVLHLYGYVRSTSLYYYCIKEYLICGNIMRIISTCWDLIAFF